MRFRYTKGLTAAVAVIGLAGTAQAAPLLWVHDSAGNLATVDVPTGTVSLVGNMGVTMTDIAFDPSGNLFGLSFTSLYSINAATAAPTLIGAHGVPGGNALVFGTGDTLYAAGSSTSLYTLDISTGAGTSLFNTGFASAGDLAFNGGGFFLAATNDQLIDIDLGASTASAVGPFGFSSVFGLATADNGILYGVSGANVFLVDTTTGAGTLVSNYGGQGLGNSFGSSFFTESGAGTPSVPEPGSLALLGPALAGLGFVSWRRRVRA